MLIVVRSGGRRVHQGSLGAPCGSTVSFGVAWFIWLHPGVYQDHPIRLRYLTDGGTCWHVGNVNVN